MLRAAAAILVALAAAGCAAAPEGPAALAFEAKDYPAAFDAALEAARADRLQPVVADRDLGIIETAPRTAGSFLEPWRTDNAGAEDTLSHTVNHERRRVRIEFVPEGWSAPVPDPSQRIAPAAIPGTDRAESRFELSKSKGPVEMRVWVYVDRSFRADEQVGDWTLSQVRFSSDPTTDREQGDETTRTPVEWTPIGRDPAYERRLGGRIQAALAASGTPARPVSVGSAAPGAAERPEAAATPAVAASESSR